MNFAPNGRAVDLEPEEQFDAYAKRDPRAGQGIAEHDVGLTLFAAATPDKGWRTALTLPEIAEIIGSAMVIDGHRLTTVTLSEGGTFTGFVISHRDGLIGFDAAIEALERWNLRGIVFAPPDEDGWHALIPLSGPRQLDVFEIFAARVYGLFAGKLDPMLFKPGHTVTIGGVRHLQVVEGEFLDRNDRTYAGSIFRDGSTVRSRSSGCPAGIDHSPVQRVDRVGPALLPPAAGVLRAAVAAAIEAFEKSGKMLDAALAYAAHGIPIFPVTVDKIPVPPRNKDANGKPIPGTGSFKKATTDEAQIRAWWRRAEYLIGLPMGGASGVCCIDVDTSEDHADGVAEWVKIAAQHEPIATREHRSATGGPHLIFDFAQPLGCSTGDLPAGIEVKGEGSYIVVPPSVRKGRSYTVHNDIDPGPLPTWLYELISTGQPCSSGEPFRGDITADAVELAGALAAIPNANVSWDDWKAMGLRIYASLGPAGFILFDQWSQKSGKYDAENTAEAWEEIEASPPDRTGAGAIFKRARQHGWAPKLAECAPTYPSADGDISAARHEIKEVIGAFWAKAEAWHGQHQDLPPVEAIRIETGLGKTEQAIADVAAGGRQGLVYTVDRHLLGDKIEERLAAVGVSAKVFRGRGADDPLHPGQQMCLDLARVNLAMKLHADVSSTCCIQRRNGLVCPLFAGCGYQRQPRGATPAVWVTAHDMLFHVQKVFGKPRAVIVDERLWPKGIRGIEHEEGDIEWTVPLDSLVKDAASADWRVSSRAYYRKALGAALASQADNGGVERWHLAAHLTAMQCTEAVHLEWATMPEVGMHPGMSAAAIRRLGERKDLIDAVQHSRKVIRVWEEVRDLLRNKDIAVSGRLRLTQSNGQRVVEWRGVAKISKQFQAPTLLLDATLPEKPVLQVYHPQVEVTADIRVALPTSVKVRQVLHAPTSSRKLNAVEYLDSVRRYILQRWLETERGPTLVICQQKVEGYLQQCGLPGNITVAHYNNIAGLDDFKEVRLKILVGRTAPGPQAMEALAAVLSGAESSTPAVASGAGGFAWYPQVQRGIRLRDGRGIRTWGDQHPDPFVEMIRWQVHEGELMQAFGRGRPVNRTTATPLDIDMLFNTCLPITVDEVVLWRAPSRLAETAVEGVMLTAPVDMVRLWPGVWANTRTADRTLATGVPALPRFEQVAYQLKGPKMNRRRGYFDRTIIADPKGWLTERLGLLAHFEVIGQGEDDEAA